MHGAVREGSQLVHARRGAVRDDQTRVELDQSTLPEGFDRRLGRVPVLARTDLPPMTRERWREIVKKVIAEHRDTLIALSKR